MKVMGVDPGSRACGYSVIDGTGGKMLHLSSGTISPPSDFAFSRKLQIIYSGIISVIEEFTPECMSIEEVFYAKNAKSAIKLGHARGVAILAAANKGLDVYEYAPTNVKLALTGNGRAGKADIKRMLYRIIGMENFEKSDTSDAVAIAICHLNSSRQLCAEGKLLEVKSGKRKRKRFTINDITTSRKNN